VDGERDSVRIHAPFLAPPAEPPYELVSGVTLRGANLTIRSTHTQAWLSLFDEWDWTGWVKYQIDLAASAGCNCIRLIGDVAGVHMGTFSAATYRTRWAQLIDYCDSIGMYVYVAGGGQSQFDIPSPSMTQADIIAVLVELGAELDGRSNVVAFDIIQETGSSWALTNAKAVTEAVRAVCDRPVTYSFPLISKPTLASINFRNTLRPYVDFFDYHVYMDFDATTLLGNYWANESAPLVVGEFGSAGTQAEQEARYDGVLAAVTADAGDSRRVAGSLAWSVVDGGTGTYGLFSDAGVERAHLTDRLALFPLAP
jgi:hypothetical protein